MAPTISGHELPGATLTCSDVCPSGSCVLCSELCSTEWNNHQTNASTRSPFSVKNSDDPLCGRLMIRLSSEGDSVILFPSPTPLPWTRPQTDGLREKALGSMAFISLRFGRTWNSAKNRNGAICVSRRRKSHCGRCHSMRPIVNSTIGHFC